MNRHNKVISPYMAVVNGKTTGLSGCSDSDHCNKASFCLRSNPALKSRNPHMGAKGACRYLIPLEN
jgi:hypothetical protein